MAEMTSERAGRSRKWQAIYLSEEEVLGMYFIRGQKLPDFIQLREIQSLPEGTKILSVHYCYERLGFLLYVEHESFSEVAEGCVIPIFPGGSDLKTKIFRLAEPNGQAGGGLK